MPLSEDHKIKNLKAIPILKKNVIKAAKDECANCKAELHAAMDAEIEAEAAAKKTPTKETRDALVAARAAKKAARGKNSEANTKRHDLDTEPGVTAINVALDNWDLLSDESQVDAFLEAEETADIDAQIAEADATKARLEEEKAKRKAP